MEWTTLRPVGASRSDRPHRRPALRVRAVDGAAAVDIINAETLYAEEDIYHLANQLLRLAEDGHTRLVLNFREVHTMSSDVLAMLAALTDDWRSRRTGWRSPASTRSSATCCESAAWSAYSTSMPTRPRRWLRPLTRHPRRLSIEIETVLQPGVTNHALFAYRIFWLARSVRRAEASRPWP